MPEDVNDARPAPEQSGIFAPMTLKQQSNPLAKPGLILAILVWPVGLVLSAIALVKARSRGGEGQLTAILGLLSGVILAVTTFAVVGTLENGPTPGDPGCTAAKAPVLAFRANGTDTTLLTNDATALQQAIGKASSQQVKSAIDAVHNTEQLYIQQLQSQNLSPVAGQQLDENLADLNRICQFST